jgi:hypothetical protein
MKANRVCAHCGQPLEEPSPDQFEPAKDASYAAPLLHRECVAPDARRRRSGGKLWSYPEGKDGPLSPNP